MIINNLDVDGTWRGVGPLKAYSPLIVDANAVLPFAISSQSFKPIAWQGSQVLQRNGGLQTIQFEARGAFEAVERFDSLALSKVPGSLIPVADDHFQDRS